MLIVGLVMVKIGSTMDTYAEEEWKADHWWRELINGPPGYYRAMTIIMGVVLIIVGAIGMLYALFLLP